MTQNHGSNGICFMFQVLPEELCVNTHLYGHSAQLNGSTGVRGAALGGQQPVIRPKGEEDEDGRQRPKEACEEQRHAQLHSPS